MSARELRISLAVLAAVLALASHTFLAAGAEPTSQPIAQSQPTSQPAAKPTLAVAPFEMLGDPGVPDAGRIIAERLLPLLAKDYRIIDQSQLQKFLDQEDLTLAGLTELASSHSSGPARPRVQLKAVQFLVVGTVSILPDGRVGITARLTEWQSGAVEPRRVAQITAENWNVLLNRLGDVAEELCGRKPAHRLDGRVTRGDGFLVVEVTVRHSDMLKRLQAARAKARKTFAQYVLAEKLSKDMDRQKLLEYARDNEKIIDAEEQDETLTFKTRYPLPQDRENQ